MNPHAATLAAQQPLGPLLIWLGILIAVVAIGGGFLLAYRRRLFAGESNDQSGLLSDLRAMRDRGELTPDEYDAARKRMAARLAGVPPPPSAARPQPPTQPGTLQARPGFDLTGAPLPPSPTPDKDSTPPTRETP